MHAVESLGGAFASQEFVVNRVNIAGNKVRSVGIGASNKNGGNAHHIGCKTSRDKVFDGGLRRNQHFPPHMTAFFLRGQLVFKVDACRASFDHRFHQFKDVQGATKASFGVGDNGSKPVG